MTTAAVDGAELMTVWQITDYLKVSRSTVQRWCRDRELPAVKIGKEFRVRRADIDRWYESKRPA